MALESLARYTQRRRILKLISQLQPLDSNDPAELRTVRDDVFAKSCLELQTSEQQQILLEILNYARQPIAMNRFFSPLFILS